MSEFSESYHIIADDATEGIELLQRAGQGGLVYPASNGWVTVLPDYPIYQANQELIRHNEGILFHCAYAEDHGWSFALYEQGRLISRYECSWEEDISHDKSNLHQAKLAEVLNRHLTQEITVFQLAQLWSAADFEELFEQGPAYRMAELLGITHYEWLDYVHAEQDLQEGAGYLTTNEVMKVTAPNA